MMVLRNMWSPTARLWLIHVWTACAVLALATGPPVATFAATSPLGWYAPADRQLLDNFANINRRSLFYAAAIITAVLAVLFSGVQESRPSKVLRNGMSIVARKTSFDQLSTNEDDGAPDANTFVRTTLIMPVKFFLTEPIVFFTSSLAAIVYGVLYLFVRFTLFIFRHFPTAS